MLEWLEKSWGVFNMPHDVTYLKTILFLLLQIKKGIERIMESKIIIKNGKKEFVDFKPKYNDKGVLETNISSVEELEALYNYVVDNNIEKWTAIYRGNHFSYDENIKKPKNVHEEEFNVNIHYKKPEEKPVVETQEKKLNDIHVVDIKVKKVEEPKETVSPQAILDFVTYLEKSSELLARFAGEYKKLAKDIKTHLDIK